MRSVWIWILLLGLCAGGSRVLAAAYIPGPPITLKVSVSSRTVDVGIPVKLTAAFGDQDYAVDAQGRTRGTVDDAVTLSTQTTGGQFTRTSADGVLPAEFSFVATDPGYYLILFTARNSGNYATDAPSNVVIKLTVTNRRAVPVPDMHVGANPQTIQLDQGASSTIVAQLLGNDVAGKTVHFLTTVGQLSAASAVTNSTGLATITLSAGTADLGTGIIIAYAEHTAASTTVEITPHPP